MASACALAMFSGKNLFAFVVQKRLRAFLDPIFMGGGRGGKACACGQNVNSAARMFPQKTSAAASAFGYDSSREKAILENPQIFQNCEIK